MLTGKQRHYLRGLGHALRPLVQLGKDGVDAGLIAALDRALIDHELVKVKVGEHAELDRHAAADQLAAATKSELAQVLGHIVLLYRAHPEEPTIALPGAKGEPAKPAKLAKATKPAKPAKPTQAKRVRRGD